MGRRPTQGTAFEMTFFYLFPTSSITKLNYFGRWGIGLLSSLPLLENMGLIGIQCTDTLPFSLL